MKYIITLSDVGRDIADIIKEQKKPRIVKPKYSDWDMEFAVFAFDSIQKQMPNFKPPNMSEWAITARKMRELDKRDKEEMGRLWNWARRDNFWRTNILSMGTLRKHYDRLSLLQVGNQQPQSLVEKLTNNDWAIGIPLQEQ